MSIKKKISFLVIGLVIFVFVVIYFVDYNLAPNRGSARYFCTVKLTSSKLLKRSGRLQGETFKCPDGGKKEQVIECHHSSGGRGVVGGWSYRYVIKCDNDYYIVEGASNFGEKIYGPYGMK